MFSFMCGILKKKKKKANKQNRKKLQRYSEQTSTVARGEESESMCEAGKVDWEVQPANYKS